MESRAFIKAADTLAVKIVAAQHYIGGFDEIKSNSDSIQRELNQLFAGLQNPTLPTAFRLRDIAYRNGFYIDQRALARLKDFEYWAA